MRLDRVNPDMSLPFVSVLIDTYNHERFIEQAVSSALAQDFPATNRDILVVDDGSTDATPEILRKFEPYIRILRKSNGGQASAFNHAIPQCRGEIVAFLDGDDWWAPGKLSAVVNAFAVNPAVGVVGNGIREVLPDGRVRDELVREVSPFRLGSFAGARTFRLRKSFLGTSRMAYRAEILRRIGPVPESLVFEADEYLFTLAAWFADVLVLREPLTLYRLHDQNLFQISGESQAAALRRKRAVLIALADALRQRFTDERVPSDIAAVVIDTVQAEADLLGLSLDAASPLQTIRVELRNFRAAHDDLSPVRWLFKCASLFPALFLSSRRYASLKQRIASNPLYRRCRARFFPVLQPTHVDRRGHWNRP